MPTISKALFRPTTIFFQRPKFTTRASAKYNGLGFDSILVGYIVVENVTRAQGAAGTDVTGMCGRHPCKK
jgi:hypothetical protein